LQNTWPYGYSMPIAVRYTQDAFSRSGWFWPVDAKGEPLKATSYMAVGFYVAKYDQVYAQNEMLAYQQKESTARVASIMENTNLSKQQQVSEIMRQMLTQAQTAGQYFT